MEERKRRNFYLPSGSQTRVFSISQERPQATALLRPPLGEPIHMGTSPAKSLDYFQTKETRGSCIQMGCDLFHPKEVLQQIFLSHICST